MIIGVTGRIASGKGVLSDFLQGKGFQYMRLSSFLYEEADRLGISKNRESMQALGNKLRRDEGNEILAKLIVKKIKQNNLSKIIIDSIRNPSEVKYLKENLKDFKLISFDAPQKPRFERMLERNKINDPKTWDEFLKADEKDFGVGESESGQGVGKCMEMADYKLLNDSSLGEVQREIEEIYNELEDNKSNVDNFTKVKIKKLHPDAILPRYSKEGDAGMDVYAITKKSHDNFIEYGTGLSLEIPKGHVCLIFPRSSVSNKKLSLANSVGILDSGYRGELIFRFYKHGNLEYDVGDRVGQFVVIPFPEVKIEEVHELSDSDRGEGGFGSTGK